ncbi:MAG: hypothetical protein RID81_07200 [Sandaracinaceae bacterium]
MVARRWIDPDARDYVLEHGRPTADATSTSLVYLRLATERGSCPVLPSLGSRFHEIRKVTSSTPRALEAYAREAVADLIASGRIRSVTIAGSVDGDRMAVVVSFRDRAGQTQLVRFSRRVG